MKQKKYRVGAVSYLNTKPLLFGMEQPFFQQAAEVSLHYPSRLAELLKQDELDVALLPVAAIPEIPGARIVGTYGIASDGDVASVCIFSEQPLEKLDTILLDYQSRTSVRLAALLLDQYWRNTAARVAAGAEYINAIRGHVGGVIIGDRALQALGRFPYHYDLATAWHAWTGMPFVFAAWVANKDLPDSFCTLLDKANSAGLERLPQIAATQPQLGYSMERYYMHNIRYELTPARLAGLDHFLSLIRQ